MTMVGPENVYNFSVSGVFAQRVITWFRGFQRWHLGEALYLNEMPPEMKLVGGKTATQKSTEL